MKRFINKLNSRIRLSVFRSSRYMYAQLIDDEKQHTVASATDMKDTEKDRMKRAFAVGESLAKQAVKKGITKIYLDRGSYKYHGRVKALAEGARKGGLLF